MESPWRRTKKNGRSDRDLLSEHRSKPVQHPAGYGNLNLTLGQQSAFVEESAEIFCRFRTPGGQWNTPVRLGPPETDVLRSAWELRTEQNAKPNGKGRLSMLPSGVPHKKRGKR